ncbi:MAG: ParB/RepB/Spo0J family partition protein [Eubacteriales bacterium]|nr:ParB/RepB/Spo0J family partition protein [Eubacteriales bacterium]
MAAPKKRALGKGLESLFGDMEIKPNEISKKEGNSDGNNVGYININEIRPNVNQPRKAFDQEKISELAASILEHGLIQPIVVRKQENGYEIVAGERRYRAAREAGLKTIPCLIRELSDEQNMLLSIIENVQREELNAIEEASAISRMIDTYGLTQEQVSKSISKSRPYITNALRLLKLPESIREDVVDGRLSAGHARAILGATNPEAMKILAKKVIEEGLSVRKTESLAGEQKKAKAMPVRRNAPKSRDAEIVEEQLKVLLGTKVSIKEKGKKGKIEIEYYSGDERERIIEMLKTLE